MTLMLKTEVALSIAIRHYSNSIYSNIQRVDEESGKLNYKYLNEMIAPFNTEMTSIQNGLVALNNTTLEKGAVYTEKKLIEYDAMIKTACLELMRKIEIKKDSLKLFASKFDDLLMAILTLAKRDVSTFVKQSMTKKSEKLANLLEGTPTYSVVSSALRLPELQSGSILESAKEKVVYNGRRNYERYNKDSGAEAFLEAYIRPIVSPQLLDEAVAQVKKVIVYNEDGKTFCEAILPKTNEQWWDKNHKKLEQVITEVMVEI